MSEKEQKPLKRSPVFWGLIGIVLIWAVPMLALGSWIIVQLVYIYVKVHFLNAEGLTPETLASVMQIVPWTGFILGFTSILTSVIAMVCLVKRKYTRAKIYMGLAVGAQITTSGWLLISNPYDVMADGDTEHMIISFIPIIMIATILFWYCQKYQKLETCA